MSLTPLPSRGGGKSSKCSPAGERCGKCPGCDVGSAAARRLEHLGVLRKVGIVSVTKQGQQRLYQLEAKELKSVHDWTKKFEQHWSHQLDRIKQRAERKAREQRGTSN